MTHLDLATLAALEARHHPRLITPLGNDSLLRGVVPSGSIMVRDWGETASLGPLTLHVEPCHHWSARGMTDRSMALWALS